MVKNESMNNFTVVSKQEKSSPKQVIFVMFIDERMIYSSLNYGMWHRMFRNGEYCSNNYVYMEHQVYIRYAANDICKLVKS